MTQPLHVIYIPGLGDSRAVGQEMVVRTWNWWGVDAELLRMNWSDDESWESKLQRLLSRIDELTDAGKRVALVGSSAGAAAVITAFTARKSQIAGCVIIAGKVNRPENISEKYRRNNPAFVAAAEACKQALQGLDMQDRKRILSRYALFDEVINKQDSQIEGARNQTVLSVGHGPTIGIQIILGSSSFLTFLRGLK